MALLRTLIFFFVITCSLCAQEETDGLILDNGTLYEQSITEKDLEPYTTDNDFNYETEESKENALDRFINWLKNALQSFFESIFGVEAATGIILFIFRILPYLLLGFLVFLLLRFFLKVNSNNLIGKSQPQGQVFLSDEEHIIKNEDILALIKTAIANDDYRLAIRYYYLLVLKQLTNNDQIAWEPQKTNDDYLNELENLNLKKDFETITRIYDYVWYGEFQVDATGFDNLKKSFEHLNFKIQSS